MDRKVELKDVNAWLSSYSEDEKLEKLSVFLVSILRGIYPVDEAIKDVLTASGEVDNSTTGSLQG